VKSGTELTNTGEIWHLNLSSFGLGVCSGAFCKCVSFRIFSCFYQGFFRFQVFQLLSGFYLLLSRFFLLLSGFFSNFEAFLDFLGASGAPTGEK
jgi:hypothetical protein